ncbi:MAG: hypothetical protein RAP70_01445 [Candidatus Celaenobacter antarcticus]|nr:hypothetical protein [Candidatus Celaenobacter antarcticus]
MKKNEKIVLIVAVALVVLALALYFINFGDGTFSDDKADWGAFGMYFSGLITPLLLIVIICLVFGIMKEVRDIFSESSKIEKKFQRQFTKQTRYMEPSADVVYYLQLKDERLYAVITNIGNQPAFNITVEFEFEEEVDARISNNLLPLAEISYLAPEQKSGAVCGIIDESTGSYAISEHTVRMKYKPSEKSRRIIKKEFVIDKNILNTLVPETSVEESIHSLTENIKDLENKITDTEPKTEKEKTAKKAPEQKKVPKKKAKKPIPKKEEPKPEIKEETPPTKKEEKKEEIEEVPVEELTEEPKPEQEIEKKTQEVKEEREEKKEGEKEEKKVPKRDTFDNPFLDDF